MVEIAETPLSELQNISSGVRPRLIDGRAPSRDSCVCLAAGCASSNFNEGKVGMHYKSDAAADKSM